MCCPDCVSRQSYRCRVSDVTEYGTNWALAATRGRYSSLSSSMTTTVFMSGCTFTANIATQKTHTSKHTIHCKTEHLVELCLSTGLMCGQSIVFKTAILVFTALAGKMSEVIVGCGVLMYQLDVSICRECKHQSESKVSHFMVPQRPTAFSNPPSDNILLQDMFVPWLRSHLSGQWSTLSDAVVTFLRFCRHLQMSRTYLLTYLLQTLPTWHMSS